MNLKPNRPVGVTLIALAFLWIGCIGTLFLPFIALNGGTSSMWRLALGSAIHSQMWLRIVSHAIDCVWFLAYVAYAVIGFGLWKQKNWARKSVLVITLVLLVGALGVSIVFVRPILLGLSVLGMALVECGWLAWYLMRPRVKYAFGAWKKYSPAGEWIEPPGLSSRGRIGIGMLAPASLVVLFAIPLVLTVETMMRNSDAYRMTMHAANESPCVRGALGSPFQPGWNITGRIQESSKKGSAELGIPVKGPKGQGDLEVHAKKLDGNWVIEALVFTHGPTRTNLIPADSGTACH